MADPSFFTTPTGVAIIAAGGSLVGALLGSTISSWTLTATHRQRIAADEGLAERKFDFDRQLASRKAGVEADLAERKFKYDRELGDHKRRVELAEIVLADFFQMADVVRAIRSPASSRGEAASRQRSENEPEEVARDKDTYFVPLARIRENSEFISGLMSKKYRSKAVLGNKIDESFKAVHEVIIRIQVSANTLSSMTGRGRIALARNETLWRQCEADIWSSAPGEDQLQPMIDQAIAIAESICRPILEKGQPT